jgi:hypothetical protein
MVLIMVPLVRGLLPPLRDLKTRNPTEGRLNDMPIRNLIAYYYVNLNNGK